MEWHEIVFQLLDDPMIQCCGCDGLLDAFCSLRGLTAMDELTMGGLSDEFILKIINLSIDARNRYTWMNGWEKLPYVENDGGDWKWMAKQTSK